MTLSWILNHEKYFHKWTRTDGPGQATRTVFVKAHCMKQMWLKTDNLILELSGQFQDLGRTINE